MKTTTFATLALAALIFATPLFAQPGGPPPQTKREFMRSNPKARAHMRKAHKHERKAMKHRMKARGEMREWKMENGMPPFGPNFGGPNCPNPQFNRAPMMQGPSLGPGPQQGYCPVNPNGPIQKRQQLHRHRAF